MWAHTALVTFSSCLYEAQVMMTRVVDTTPSSKPRSGRKGQMMTTRTKLSTQAPLFGRVEINVQSIRMT